MGAPYIALGLYFSFCPTTYSMIIPFFVYMTVCIVGGY